MKKLTLYHNSECSKCRKATEILNQSGVPYEVVEYLRDPPSIETLDSLLRQLGIEPEQLVRKGEDEYEALVASGALPGDRATWLRVLSENPILIERPIVSDGQTAVIGRPPEKITEWLKTVLS
jgi:arsenate reductase